jgi:hypothetical protein
MVISRKLWHPLYRHSDVCGRADVVQRAPCRRHTRLRLRCFACSVCIWPLLESRQYTFCQTDTTWRRWNSETGACSGGSVSTVGILTGVITKSACWGLLLVSLNPWSGVLSCCSRRLISGTKAAQSYAAAVCTSRHSHEDHGRHTNQSQEN